MEISSSAAVPLVGRMQELGLARVADGRVLLTEEGRRYALEVIRAHRLWERYLADETGVDPLEWHERAERKEHKLTREDADALARRLGNPRFDPHGDPIPTADGSVLPLSAIPGYEARHRIRPGLTGIAQVYAARDLPRTGKFRYDLLYQRKAGFCLDLRLIAQSFWITARGRWEDHAPPRKVRETETPDRDRKL